MKFLRNMHIKREKGDKSLDYWKRVHEDFFSRCLNEVGLKFTLDMMVVCEEFVVVECVDDNKE